MKVLFAIAHVLLGLIFLIFGLNGLYTFIPIPEFHPFMEIMVDTHFIAAVKIPEITGGVLLIIRRYTLIAMIILGPIVINIFLYHLLIDPRNWIAGAINLVLYGLLFLGYWDHFKPLFKKKPNGSF